MSVEQLAACVFVDGADSVLLLHRTDHNQWQLPGGRVKVSTYGALAEDMRLAAARQADEELGLRLEPTQLRHIGGAIFRQGLVDYSCEWFYAERFSGEPFLCQPEVYDDWDYFNLYKYGIGRIGLSPNVEKFKKELQDGTVIL